VKRFLTALACLTAIGAGASQSLAQSTFPPRGSAVYGANCYWFRGHHYCNRYCWREIDGHRYCQERLRGAGTQAPPPIGLIEPDSPVYRQGRPYR
jgi:hypothetical protein